MYIALIVVLGLSTVTDLALGAWASVAWESFVDTWLPGLASLGPLTALPAGLDSKVTAALGDAHLMGLVLGLALLCFAALQGLALYWIRSEKEEGHRMVILFGIYLIASSIITFGVFHRIEFLLLDGVRGALLTVLAVLVLNSPSVVRELRLPEQRAADRPRSDRSPGRSEHGRSSGVRRQGGRTERRPSRDRGRGRDRRQSRRAQGKSVPAEQAKTESATRGEGRLKPQSNGLVRETAGRRHERGGRKPSRVESPRETRPEDAGTPVTRKVENRSRSAEELISQDASVFGRRGDDLRDLTVVVRGGPPSLRSKDVPPPVARKVSDREASAESGGGGRRRRGARKRGRSEGSRPDSPGDVGGPDSSGASHEASREPESDRRHARSAAEESGDVRSSAEVVEALDMLSLLEPKGGPDREEAAEPYGHIRKPVRRGRHASHRHSSPSPEPTEGEGSHHPQSAQHSGVRPRTDDGRSAAAHGGRPGRSDRRVEGEKAGPASPTDRD